MALQGNLSDLPLVDLVQVLTLQTKNGILSVNSKFSQAQVCFSSHKIYSARVHHTEKNGQLRYLHGEAALYDLLRWPEGQFSFELIAVLPDDQNVYTNWDYLILEHCRRQDEAQKAAISKLRWLDSSPRLSPNPSMQAEITLNLEEWRILLQVNGSITLRQIAATIHQPENEVVVIAEHLEELGLLSIAEAASTRPVVNQQASGSSFQPSQSGQPTASSTSNYRPTSFYEAANQPGNQTSPEIAATQYRPTPLLQMPPANRVVSVEKPKVQRGLLNGLMAKLRGL